MTLRELIQENIRALRFNVGTERMTDEVITDVVMEAIEQGADE